MVSKLMPRHDAFPVFYSSKDMEGSYFLSGGDSVESILDGRSSPISADKMLEIAHTLMIGNEGPGLMPRTVVDIRLPVWNDTRRLVTDYRIVMTHKDSRDVVITTYDVSRMWINDVSSEFDDQSTSHAVPADKVIRRLHMVCNSSMTPRCENYRYVVDSLKVGDKLEVTVSFLINTVVLLSMPTIIEAKHTIHMAVTPAQLTQRIPSTLDIEALLRQRPIFVKTNTRLIRRQHRSTLPFWVIPVSIMASMIMFTALVVILRTCGFFKRDWRDQLAMMRELAPPTTAGPSDEPGDYDEIAGPSDEPGDLYDEINYDGVESYAVAHQVQESHEYTMMRKADSDTADETTLENQQILYDNVAANLEPPTNAQSEDE